MAEALGDADDDTLLETGDLLAAKYEIVRTIGSGGMGVVYEARNLQTDARVALKLLRKRARAVDTAVRRFAREARAAGTLRSPHVARVLDADTTADRGPFIVMEYYEGRDLLQELRARGGRLDAQRACEIALEACAGLAEAHARGFVHRDLKPANLFLAREGGTQRVRLLDFGISKSVDSAEEITRTMATLGTLHYMAPEQVRDAKSVDHRADLWALGVILYRCLAGRPPFQGAPTAVAIAIATEPPTPLGALAPEVPPALEAAIMRALEKDPSRRPQTVAELAASLSPFADPHLARAALTEIDEHLGARGLDGAEIPAPIDDTREAPIAPIGTHPDRAAPSRRRSMAGAIAIFAIVAVAATFVTPSRVPLAPRAVTVLAPPDVPSVATRASASASSSLAPPSASAPAAPSASTTTPKRPRVVPPPRPRTDPDLL